jgi:hypothetical protein
MCQNLNTKDNNCELKTTLPYGSKYDPKLAYEINNTFKELAESRDVEKKSILGYSCGGPKCCYVYNQLVNTTECPYYK